MIRACFVVLYSTHSSLSLPLSGVLCALSRFCVCQIQYWDASARETVACFLRLLIMNPPYFELPDCAPFVRHDRSFQHHCRVGGDGNCDGALGVSSCDDHSEVYQRRASAWLALCSVLACGRCELCACWDAGAAHIE